MRLAGVVSSEKKNCLQQIVRMYEVPRDISESDLGRFTALVHIERFSERVTGALDFFTVTFNGHWQMNGSLLGRKFTITYFKVVNDGESINEKYQDDIENMESLLTKMYSEHS